jgi:hypothetical protein
MLIYHQHHIVPKHAGGTDDPSNLIKLTIEEHAEAHRILWEQHGRIEDKLAWLMLAGKTDEAETARIELARETQNRRWSIPEARQKQSERMKGNSYGVGREWVPTVETKGRISAAQKERYKQNPHLRIRSLHTEETKRKISESKKGTRLTEETKQKISDANTGRKQTDYQKQRAREANAATWEVITPTGETLIITNLRQFCLQHYLSQGNLVTFGHTKGYRATKRPT